MNTFLFKGSTKLKLMQICCRHLHSYIRILQPLRSEMCCMFPSTFTLLVLSLNWFGVQGESRSSFSFFLIERLRFSRLQDYFKYKSELPLMPKSSAMILWFGGRQISHCIKTSWMSKSISVSLYLYISIKRGRGKERELVKPHLLSVMLMVMLSIL